MIARGAVPEHNPKLDDMAGHAMEQPQPVPKAPLPTDESAKGAYQYLPIECPNCGFQGKVKIARLDQTFTCKQCNQVFHVTRDGTVAGERPPDEVAAHPSAPIADDKPSWIEVKFRALPAAAKWGVLGAVLLVVALVAAFFMEPEQPLPGDLEDRAVLAGKAFGKGDWKTFKRLAKPKTARDLGKWFDKSRPEDWSDLNTESKVAVKVGREEKILRGYEKSKPILDARTPAEVRVPEITGDNSALTVNFFWSQDEKGDWWLDGERMLKESRPIKGAAAKKNAEENDDAANEPAEEG